PRQKALPFLRDAAVLFIGVAFEKVNFRARIYQAFGARVATGYSGQVRKTGLASDFFRTACRTKKQGLVCAEILLDFAPGWRYSIP
ncbi:MAG: hypothetical protein RSE59_02935, partial [Clostridia bacterium]